MGYLTPDALTGTSVLTLTVPDQSLIRAAIIGALSEMIYSSNWESYGSATPADTAAAIALALDNAQWDASGGGGGSVAELHEVQQTSGQSIGTNTKLTANTVIQDVGGWWDAINQKWVIPDDGLYCINVLIPMNDTSRDARIQARLNGSETIEIGGFQTPQAAIVGQASAFLQLSADDEIELYSVGVSSWAIPSFGYGPARYQLVKL